MKTGMELVKEIHEADCYYGFDKGMAHAADLAEAWLREADKWTRKAEVHDNELQYIRYNLLGTTQKPKQEGESSK